MVASGWINLDRRRLSVTLSIGVAVIRPAESAATIIERADMAMLAAKTAGRNRTAIS